MDSFPSFDTLLVSIEAELVSTRSPFVVALQYFRGHGRVNAASVHESAMEETREQKEMKELIALHRRLKVPRWSEAEGIELG